jgi:uncharacterized protein with GYD domain
MIDPTWQEEDVMSRYLITARYNSDGAKGLLAQGGTARRTAVEKAVTDLGGHLESFDFAFGEDDAYVIVDLPDNRSAIALALSVGASGRVEVSTTPLIAPEEIDVASGQQVSYSPPGG